jgi:hypothetical protein
LTADISRARSKVKLFRVEHGVPVPDSRGLRPLCVNVRETAAASFGLADTAATVPRSTSHDVDVGLGALQSETVIAASSAEGVPADWV